MLRCSHLIKKKASSKSLNGGGTFICTKKEMSRNPRHEMRSPNRKTTPTRDMTTSSSWMNYRAPSREICKHPPSSHYSSFFILHFQFRHEQKPVFLLSCACSLLVKRSCITNDERASVLRNTTDPGSTHAVLVKCPGKPRNEIVLVGFRRVAMAESDGKDQQNHQRTTSRRLRRVYARIQTRSFKKT